MYIRSASSPSTVLWAFHSIQPSSSHCGETAEFHRRRRVWRIESRQLTTTTGDGKFGNWTPSEYLMTVLSGLDTADTDATRSLSFVALAVWTESATVSLHFAWVVDDAKCIVVSRVCVSVCLSAAACLHYCTDPDLTWRSGSGCHPYVHYWADLQSGRGLRCYGNITRTRNVSEYLLVLTLCLVIL